MKLADYSAPHQTTGGFFPVREGLSAPETPTPWCTLNCRLTYQPTYLSLSPTWSVPACPLGCVRPEEAARVGEINSVMNTRL